MTNPTNAHVCVFARCHQPAAYLAFSTVGAGHAHACDKHAPAWLKAGRYSRFYSPVPVEKNEALAQATARALSRHAS